MASLTRGPAVKLAPAGLLNLGLIVTELVINALKHAFPGERSGKILVDYHAQGADWALLVSDNGVGTPETLADARAGLGTSIVEALANQLGATVETEGGYPGTTVSITHVGSRKIKGRSRRGAGSALAASWSKAAMTSASPPDGP